MRDLIIEKWNNVGLIFWRCLWKCFLAISVIVSASGAFTNFSYIKQHPYRISIIIFTITTIVSLLYVIYKLVSHDILRNSVLDLPKEVERFVQLLYKEKNYLDVVRFGSPISRFLWLSGNNKQRITIGKMVEDSASKIGRLKEQISALIDDIGWTYAVIGDNEKARQNICNGIEKAEKEGHFYFAAKGERHLAGVESNIGNKERIIEHLQKAQEFTKKITDKNEKDEMEASLYLAKSEYFFENLNYPEAESNAKLAKAVLADDLDRIVKVNSLLGNIYFSQQKFQQAKDEFNQGYNRCKGFRKDEYAKNAVGLAKIEIHENNLKTAKNYLIEAKEIFTSLGKNIELIEVNNLLRHINNAT